MIASSQIIWIGVEQIQMEPSIPAQTRRLRLQAASGQRIWTGFYGSIKSAGSVLLKLAAVYFGVCYWLRLAMRACMLPPHVTECDAQIQAQLQALHVREDEPAKGKKRGRARNAPKFDLRTQLFQMCGVDLTRIDGIDVPPRWW